MSGDGMESTGSDGSPPIVTSVEPQVAWATLQTAAAFASTSPKVPATLHNLIAREASNIRRAIADRAIAGQPHSPDDRLSAGPVLAILLDPIVAASPAGDQRDNRLRQIIEETNPAPRRSIRVLLALASVSLILAVVATMALSRGYTPMIVMTPMILMTLCGVIAALTADARPPTGSRSTVQIRIDEARQLATITAHQLPPGAVPQGEERQPSAAPLGPRTLTVTDVQQAVDDLLGEWAKYQLDIEAWYVTKPLLHDTTGTVATTVAYERAMQALIAAADDLPPDAAPDRINEALQLADAAWDAWHAADEYAAKAGLGDRTPNERAALQRLGRLVERLTRSAATDPELPMIKRSIQDCLDRITTVSVSWTDIATLPAIEAAGLLPQIQAGHRA